MLKLMLFFAESFKINVNIQQYMNTLIDLKVKSNEK